MRQSVAVATVHVRPRVFLCVCALLPLSSGTGAALMKGKPLPSWCALTSGAEKVILCALWEGGVPSVGLRQPLRFLVHSVQRGELTVIKKLL